MEIIDLIISLLGMLLTAGALFYGCVHVRPGAIMRWGIYGAGAVIATQFGWLPLLPSLGLRADTNDQYVALVVATLLLKIVMEKLVPLGLMEVDDDEEI